MFNINYLIIKQYSLLPKDEVKSNMASCVTVSGAYALVVYLSKKSVLRAIKYTEIHGNLMDSKNMTVQLNKNKQKHPFVIKYSFTTNKDNNGK